MSDANRSVDKKRRRGRAFLSGYRVSETPVSAGSDAGYDDEDYGSESQEAGSSASDYLSKIADTQLQRVRDREASVIIQLPKEYMLEVEEEQKQSHVAEEDKKQEDSIEIILTFKPFEEYKPFEMFENKQDAKDKNN